MNLKGTLTLLRNLKNEMRGIRQQINEEKDREKKTKMLKAYRKMSKTLGWKAD